MSVLIVGEAPARPGIALLDRQPLTGYSGRRIADMAGIEWETYLRETRRENVVPVLPASTAWPAADAARRASELVKDRSWTTLLGVGKRVADALGLDEPLVWTHLPGGRRIGWVPHTSGRNRWYNDPAHRDQASRFLSTLLSHDAG